MKGLDGCYCAERKQCCRAGRAVGSPKKDGPAAVKHFSVSAHNLRPEPVSAHNPELQASLEASQGKKIEENIRGTDLAPAR